MSKVDELRERYYNVTTSTFNKFVQGDKTKTKKYLEFMLKTWVNKEGQIKSAKNLIELVNGFDELLPYIQNKDIYHKDYNDINFFIDVIDRAIDAREEKTFNRDEHIYVIDENEDYLLLQPKTHKGSLKYGANTKWCTASKNNKQLFENYNKAGCLVYLINKKGDRQNGYEKVAFYLKDKSALISTIDIYNTLDNTITEDQLINKGWKEEEVIKVILSLRVYARRWQKIKSSVIQIEKFQALISSLDFDGFKQSLAFVESLGDYSYISDARKTVDDFLTKIKNTQI